MPWSKRAPQSFPARFPEAIREAVANFGKPVLINTFLNRKGADHIAEQFRYYRWCLRQEPKLSAIGQLEATYALRTYIELTEGHWFLYLTARETNLSELSALNPHLADLISKT